MRVTRLRPPPNGGCCSFSAKALASAQARRPTPSPSPPPACLPLRQRPPVSSAHALSCHHSPSVWWVPRRPAPQPRQRRIAPAAPRLLRARGRMSRARNELRAARVLVVVFD
eukprot:5261202-Pleurochrysis_carterae.AAC.1